MARSKSSGDTLRTPALKCASLTLPVGEGDPTPTPTGRVRDVKERDRRQRRSHTITQGWLQPREGFHTLPKLVVRRSSEVRELAFSFLYFFFPFTNKIINPGFPKATTPTRPGCFYRVWRNWVGKGLGW